MMIDSQKFRSQASVASLFEDQESDTDSLWSSAASLAGALTPGLQFGEVHAAEVGLHADPLFFGFVQAYSASHFGTPIAEGTSGPSDAPEFFGVEPISSHQPSEALPHSEFGVAHGTPALWPSERGEGAVQQPAVAGPNVDSPEQQALSVRFGGGSPTNTALASADAVQASLVGMWDPSAGHLMSFLEPGMMLCW